MFDPSIDRLGFEAWADNLIVNAIEDMVGDCPIIRENEDASLQVILRRDGNELYGRVRAYTMNKGWVMHERTIKR